MYLNQCCIQGRRTGKTQLAEKNHITCHINLSQFMLIRIICSRFTIILLKIKGKCWRMSCAQSFDKQRSWLNEAKVGKELIRWNITACSDRNGQAKQKKRGGALRARWTDEGRVSRRQINQKDIKGKWAEGGKEWKSADRLSHAVPAPLRLSLLSDLRAIVPHGCMEGAGAQRTQYTHKHTHTHTHTHTNVWEKSLDVLVLDSGSSSS